MMHYSPTSMEAEAKSVAGRDRKSAVPAAWAAASAEIVDRFDDPMLPGLLGRALSTLIEFEYSVVFVYRGKGNPLHIHDTFPNPQARAGVLNYVRNTYVLNPLYNAYQRGLKTGVHWSMESRFENTGYAPQRQRKSVTSPMAGRPAARNFALRWNCRAASARNSRCRAKRPKAVSRTTTLQVCRR